MMQIWRKACKTNRSMKLVLSRHQHRVCLRAQRVTFCCWKQQTTMCQQRNVVIDFLAGSTKNVYQHSRAAFSKWREVTCTHWSLRRCLHSRLKALLPASLCIPLLQAAWDGWIHCTERGRQQARHIRVVCAWGGICIKQVQRLLSGVLRCWQDLTRRKIVCRRLQTAAAAKALRFMAGKVLRTWHVFHLQQVGVQRSAMHQVRRPRPSYVAATACEQPRTGIAYVQ